MIFKIIGGKAVRYDSGGTDKIDDLTVDFSQADSRENIAPTDTMKIILGKIMKWFSDLSAGAASSLLGQNLTAGRVLVSDDGGKVAASDVDASKVGFLSGVTGDVQGQINSLNSAMESISGISDNSAILAAVETLKSVWASLPKDTIGTTTLTAGGPMVGCLYYKLRDDYGAALFITYYVTRPAYIIKAYGQWGKPIWL